MSKNAYTIIAIFFGIQIAAQQKWSHVILETDCLPVYRYLPLQVSKLVSYGAVLDACFSLRSSFISLFFFFFVRQSDNSIVHFIAIAWNLPCHEGPFLPSILMEKNFLIGVKKKQLPK